MLAYSPFDVYAFRIPEEHFHERKGDSIVEGEP